LHVFAGSTPSADNSSVQGESTVVPPVKSSAGVQQAVDSLKDANVGDAKKVEAPQVEGNTTNGKASAVLSRPDESPRSGAMAPSDFKAIAAASAADASVFTFGDDDDYDSEEELLTFG